MEKQTRYNLGSSKQSDGTVYKQINEINNQVAMFTIVLT